jgi:hypothetical protein
MVKDMKYLEEEGIFLFSRAETRRSRAKRSLQLAVGKKTKYKRKTPNQGGFGARQDGLSSR